MSTLSRSSSEIFMERLRTARDSKGMSQGELARRAGLQASAVSHFETGARKPSFDNLRRLADSLKVTTDYLLGRADTMDGASESIEKIYRHYSGLSAEYQEVADDMVALLAKKAREKRE